MEYLFKYLFLIVVIPLILITLSFTISRTQSINPKNFHQKLVGDNIKVLSGIEDLCVICINNFGSSDQECFAVDSEIRDGKIPNQTLNFSAKGDKYTLKIEDTLFNGSNNFVIEDQNGTCVVRSFK